MKVILLEEVKGTGKKGQVINVSDGYAKNFLLPKKLAREATESALREWESEQKNRANKRQESESEARALQARLEEKEINITVKVGENGKMFGSVSAKEIAYAVSSQIGIDVERKKINLPEHIKKTGEYKIPVRLFAEVTANISVNITAQ